MGAFEFTIIASGLDPDAADFEDRFFEAGCDDATISWQKGAILLDFTREAESFDAAIQSAIAMVRAAGAQVERVEPDHLVSLADIAKRSGLTRAAITHYAAGERGRGFPAPISRVTTQNPLWDWAMVADWLYSKDRLSQELVIQAHFVREANHEIAYHRMKEVA